VKKVVTGPGVLSQRGAYSHAIVAKGTFVFTAGQVGRNAETGMVPDGIEAQTRQAIENLRAVLRAAGGDLDDVVRNLVFLADLNDRPGFDKVYLEYFTGDRPVRTRVQAGALGAGYLVEMEAIAVLPD
jgi:2-iminobutanoate/2-iminopropanoate deaminase